MAGMLAGVECARRRRLHQGGGWSDSAAHSSRRSSFCLYGSIHQTHHNTIQRIITNQEHMEEKLGGAVGEAKRRLDERLRHRKSETKRVGVVGELVYGGKRGGASKLLDLFSLERCKAALCP